MFFRTHRIGRNVYTEALESYRDDSGKPRHRCVARWHADQSFAPALGKARHDVERSTEQIAYWQGVVDRTVRPNFWQHVGRAPENAKSWRSRLDRATAHLNGLEAVHAKQPANDEEVQAATEAERERWKRMTASFRGGMPPTAEPASP